jgi:hypothetical protein|nr:MAG: hypothetical protein J07AB56_09430 [Candidatus Nanosalinarum sp. J07AB56]
MVYYVCPDCGYRQRSKAQKRVKCHRCGRSYLKRDAKKKDSKSPDSDKGTGFFNYTSSN